MQNIEKFFAYRTYRPGQRELAEEVYKACKEGKILIAEAMSGFGKTAAVLSGTLAYAEEAGCKILYICRTKREVARVLEELSLLRSIVAIKASHIFSKYDYCLLMRANKKMVPQECFKWFCGFKVSNNLCSYFLNIANLGEDLERLVSELALQIPTHNTLLERCEGLHVCPYEVNRLIIADSNIIVAPYQYLFDESAKSVLFGNNLLIPKRTVLVIDEAHNLREVLRRIQNLTLSLSDITKAEEEAANLLPSDILSSVKLLEVRFRAVLSAHQYWKMDKEKFIDALSFNEDKVWLSNLAFELSTCTNVAWYSVATERALPFYMIKVGNFLAALLSSLNVNDLVLTKWENTVGLVKVNPTQGLYDTLSSFRSAILISATLSPSKLFIDSLGIDGPHTEVYNAKFNLPITVKTIIDTGVTTKYKCRSDQMYTRIASKIAAIFSSTNNNVGVFVPSYEVLERLAVKMKEVIPKNKLLLEERNLSSQEAEKLILRYGSERNNILLAVQGGHFSEGEDIKTGIMVAAIIVGLSLPPPSPLLYAEYSYLRSKGVKRRYLILSLIPALRRAIQSAGRHLRAPGKKGLVFFMDSRFNSKIVIGLMPSWLKQDIVSGDFEAQELKILVTKFLNS